MAFRADTPDVQVVYVVDSLDFADGRFQTVEFHAAGRRFEQDVHGLAQDADGRPQNQRAIPNESRVDQYWCVTMMAQPPTMTAAVESVSPTSWSRALRMLMSPPER